jgi:hypothetical protein
MVPSERNREHPVTQSSKTQHRIIYDSTDGKQFVVHKNGGSNREFTESKRGLYYLDMMQNTEAERR